MTHSGGKPHTNIGDRGQRYEITYFDGEKRQVFGWSAGRQGAETMADSIDLNPSMEFPQIRDRALSKYVLAKHEEYLFQLWVDGNFQDDAVHDAYDVAFHYRYGPYVPTETDWFD